jgi:hypothetical protein
MLGVAARIVPDESDVADVDAEQRELSGHRPPAELSPGGRGVSPVHIRGGFAPGRTAHHDLGLRGGIGDNAVHHDPWIAVQVTSLGRGGHHRQPQLAVHEQRLNGAYPRRPIFPGCADQYDARLDQLITPDSGKHPLVGGKLRPSHVSCLPLAADNRFKIGSRHQFRRHGSAAMTH